jgi:hypothetical protein
MKPITQDRILNILEKLLNQRDTREKFITVKTALALHEIKSSFGRMYDVKCTSSKPYQVEIQIVEQPKPIDLDPLNSEWIMFSKIQALANATATRIVNIRNTYTIRRTKILEIQVNHSISGLEWKHIEPTFVTSGFTFPFFSKKLRPIASDLETLAKYKGSVIQYWVDCAPKLGLVSCYLTDGIWIPITFDKVWEKSSKFEWATISLDEYYVSPTVIDATGSDEPRREPEMDDDELHTEFHLTIGRGLDYESDSADTLSFMLVKEIPIYC